jgi:YHS domain-containing protein
MSNVTLNVPDISCEHCQRTITNTLQPVNGVRSVQVDDRFISTVETAELVDGLDGLNPVCLMDVDPATAKHTAQYAGRTIVFCAPSCRKQFLADPSAHLTL